MLKIGFIVSQYTDCLLKGDMDRAIEILQNVIENAVKYDDGEYIRIDFADEEQCRLITVSNSGCSLPENVNIVCNSLKNTAAADTIQSGFL